MRASSDAAALRRSIPHIRFLSPDAIAAMRDVPWYVKLMMRVLSRIEHGSMTLVLPDGRAAAFQGVSPGPDGVVKLNDYRTIRRLATAGSLGFAEAYLDGDWDSPDVTAVLETVVLNGERFSEFYRMKWLAWIANRVGHVLRPNTRSGAQRNIHAHYDLGNAFYSAWLDETMTYSSARWETGRESLAEAQTTKYRALCDQMGLRPGDRVLEIGCGWGGFAEYAARERGASVTCLTISKEQHAYASQRIARAGLSDRVEIRYQDYRDADGSYDRIASIEMFEAVGEKYWPAYFATLRDRLRPGGTAGLQIITIDESMFESYRRRVDFIQKYVFPGGMLPSMTALRGQAESAGLDWRGHVGFARDYARTLGMWRDAFLAAWPRIEAQGFDERFKRMWTYYLAYCEAGFRGGSIDVVQLTLAKP